VVRRGELCSAVTSPPAGRPGFRSRYGLNYLSPPPSRRTVWGPSNISRRRMIGKGDGGLFFGLCNSRDMELTT